MHADDDIAPATADRALVAALLGGDVAAFSALVERLHPRLVRLCRRFVASDAAAEDVAQDTWQAVLEGLPAFEARSALDTWIFQIALNRARTRGVRDARGRPFDRPRGHGAHGDGDRSDELESDGAGRFSWLGTWKQPPLAVAAACASPEAAAGDRELMRLLAAALEGLPEQQRLVVVLRDVELLTAAEVCALLEVSEENQRVLLHRGRARLRVLLQAQLGTRIETSAKSAKPVRPEKSVRTKAAPV